MSIKTLRKRIALVAVSALAVTGLSTVAANAAVTAPITVTGASISGGTSAARTASQTINNQVIFTFAPNDEPGDGDVIVYVTTDAGGSILSAADGSNDCVGADGMPDAFIPVNGLNFANGAKCEMEDETTATIAVTSAVAGTQVVKVQELDTDTGLYTLLSKITVTWVAAGSSLAVSAAQSSVYLQSTALGGNCTITPGANKSGDTAAIAALTAGQTAISTAPAGTELTVCIISRNGAGDLIALDTVTAISSFGDTATNAAPASDDQVGTLTPIDLTAAGTATITVIMTDVLGNSATASVPFVYYGTLSTLAISAIQGAAYAGLDSTTADSYTEFLDATSASGTLVVGLIGKDSGGRVINLGVAANSTSEALWTIDSDKVAGAPGDPGNDSSAIVADMNNSAADLSPAVYGANAAYINCGSKAEKLTVTAWGKDYLGNLVKSNSITLYCSGAVAKVDVTVASGAVNVMVTDANGYPVADGNTVTLAASNGSVVAPAQKTTADGKFSTAATFIPSTTAASSTVTAIVGKVSGTSAPIAGTGTTIESQIASLVAAIAKLQKAINKINKRLKK